MLRKDDNSLESLEKLRENLPKPFPKKNLLGKLKKYL
jgi:hypothetical protein